MAGQSIIQLVAKGTQDSLLTGTPVVTFFKSGWRQYTDFVIESIEMNFTGSVNFGTKSTVVIQRAGDLVWKCYIQVNLPELAGTNVAWTREIGHALIEEVNLVIGAQPADKHYGEWLSIWNELTLSPGKKDGYDVLIGNTTEMTTPASSIPARTIYIPLQFWFNRNVGAALPLIAMVYSEVKFEVKFRTLAEITVGTLSSTPSIANASLWVDYINLTPDERTKFAQLDQQYMVDILQYSKDTVNATNTKISINFNHPTKSLHWVSRTSASNTAKRVVDFTQGGAAYEGDHTVSLVGLKLNSNDRFVARDAATFNIIQPLQHFSNVPRRGIYSYSFALHPEQQQPTGTINLSKIDNVQLDVTTTTGSTDVDFMVFAYSYNLFRTRGGQGGLLYAS